MRLLIFALIVAGGFFAGDALFGDPEVAGPVGAVGLVLACCGAWLLFARAERGEM